MVLGRFTDKQNSDCFLYQNGGDKDRLKTNLDVHIAHIRDSGVVDANRLVKLLRVRKALHVKQFAFELLIVKLLSGSTRKSLEDQLQHALGRIAESELAIPVEDPANPFGNDLSKLISDAWPDLLATARSVLDSSLAGCSLF